MSTTEPSERKVNASPQLRAQDCDLVEFAALVRAETRLVDYPHAREVSHRTVVYDSAELIAAAAHPDNLWAVLTELASVLMDGPGIAVFRGAVDEAAVDAASDVFNALIVEEKATALAGGDHFAPAGANDRVWNVQQKLALRAPDVFAAYFAAAVPALISQAWLGPGYQITSQVNVVNPGGGAQEPHRDYHLGFMTNAQASAFPPHVHRLSPALTLQGAVAHCDMPVETGPTLYLPHSQKYVPGYVAWRRPDFKEYFKANHVQLPLAKGDAVFFNPAIFHAAGSNRTADVFRMANLLQVSSAFGRAMEAVDRTSMAMALYPTLQKWKLAGRDATEIDHVIAASAEGYAFPGDLDLDQPTDGLAPMSDAATVRLALVEGWSPDALATALGTSGSDQ